MSDIVFLTIPDTCPVCGGHATIVTSDSGIKTLVCDNPLCEGKFINILDHFAGNKGLDIKGLSKMTLEKLIDWGWINNLHDVFELKNHRAEWINKAGFGEKSVDNILAAIETAKTVPLDKFIASLGIPFIGTTLSKELVKHINSYEDLRDKAKNHFKFYEYAGFADSKTTSLWNFNFDEADLIYSYLTIPTEEIEEESDDLSLKNISVVITGSLTKYKNRAALQQDIENHGGKVVGSVSKNTNYLINNDNTSTSAKNISAKKFGIPILTEEEFFEKFLK